VDLETVVEVTIGSTRRALIYLLQAVETKVVFASERRERPGTRYGDSLPMLSSK
jgi:hypothetical protein